MKDLLGYDVWGEWRVEDLPVVARRWRRPPGACGKVCRRRRDGARTAASARWRKCLSTPWNQSNLGQKVKQNTKLSDGAIRVAAAARCSSAAQVQRPSLQLRARRRQPARLASWQPTLHCIAGNALFLSSCVLQHCSVALLVSPADKRKNPQTCLIPLFAH